ncbi:MAG: MogA/MoaB family molybdenum cofactor biosynthesis protein [Gracilibacteraceae bacterium]|jgi:molybdenum cofactor synthesis domain-containing protein|nr:MogA/MoaB family molybdenum cofactor biosynthesis protein [Gracilibacteraceae bacterium]
MITVGILTASDRGAAGQREDRSGDVIKELVEKTGWTVRRREILPDEMELIRDRLVYFTDELKLNIILTTGGTGFSPRDMTPEATLAVVERLTPGITETMRAESLRFTKKAMLSRAQAGIRRQSLIINLPGSPSGARECLEAILPALAHGIEILTGAAGDCGRE